MKGYLDTDCIHISVGFRIISDSGNHGAYFLLPRTRQISVSGYHIHENAGEYP